MSQTKITALINKFTVILFLSMAALLVLVPARGDAVTNGCYQRSSNDQNYVAITCPDQNSADLVKAGKCVTFEPNDQGIQQSTIVDCNSISLSGDTGNTGNSAIGDSVKAVKNDCQTVTADTCGIIKYIRIFIQILSAAAGVVIAASIIIGGIQYSTAGGEPGHVAAARKRISQAIFALVVYLFFFALLQWVVPGGII